MEEIDNGQAIVPHKARALNSIYLMTNMLEKIY
jgi:hypothetical protein